MLSLIYGKDGYLSFAPPAEYGCEKLTGLNRTYLVHCYKDDCYIKMSGNSMLGEVIYKVPVPISLTRMYEKWKKKLKKKGK